MPADAQAAHRLPLIIPSKPKRKMNKRLPAALFGSLLLAACLPKPAVLTMEQIRRMDYGSYPRNYEQLIKRHLAQTLIDPHSVMYGGFS